MRSPAALFLAFFLSSLFSTIGTSHAVVIDAGGGDIVWEGTHGKEGKELSLYKLMNDVCDEEEDYPACMQKVWNDTVMIMALEKVMEGNIWLSADDPITKYLMRLYNTRVGYVKNGKKKWVDFTNAEQYSAFYGDVKNISEFRDFLRTEVERVQTTTFGEGYDFYRDAILSACPDAMVSPMNKSACFNDRLFGDVNRLYAAAKGSWQQDIDERQESKTAFFCF